MKKYEEPVRGTLVRKSLNGVWEALMEGRDGVQLLFEKDYIQMNCLPIEAGARIVLVDGRWSTEPNDEQLLANRFLFRVELVEADGAVIPRYVISPNTEQVAKWLPRQFSNPFVKSITFVSDQVFRTHIP